MHVGMRFLDVSQSHTANNPSGGDSLTPISSLIGHISLQSADLDASSDFQTLLRFEQSGSVNEICPIISMSQQAMPFWLCLESDA